MGDIAIEEFFGLKPNMYSILVSDSSEYKKAKGVNKNVAAKISRNECKDVLLNKKCWRHSINGIITESWNKLLNQHNFFVFLW